MKNNNMENNNINMIEGVYERLKALSENADRLTDVDQCSPGRVVYELPIFASRLRSEVECTQRIIKVMKGEE